jgi:hypothetical protein
MFLQIDSPPAQYLTSIQAANTGLTCGWRHMCPNPDLQHSLERYPGIDLVSDSCSHNLCFGMSRNLVDMNTIEAARHRLDTGAELSVTVVPKTYNASRPTPCKLSTPMLILLDGFHIRINAAHISPFYRGVIERRENWLPTYESCPYLEGMGLSTAMLTEFPFNSHREASGTPCHAKRNRIWGLSGIRTLDRSTTAGHTVRRPNQCSITFGRTSIRAGSNSDCLLAVSLRMVTVKL